MIHYFVLGSIMVMVLFGVDLLLRTVPRYARRPFKRYRRDETIPRTNARSIRASGDPILGFDAWKKMKR